MTDEPKYPECQEGEVAGEPFTEALMAIRLLGAASVGAVVAAVHLRVVLPSRSNSRKATGQFTEVDAAGLSDMVGNLSEWTEDCGREGDCGFRVVRGGSWCVAADDLGPRARSLVPSNNRGTGSGFRVARTLD